MRIVIITVLLLAVVCTMASAQQSAGQVWNNYCQAHDFSPYPAPPQATFADCYHGDNLAGDFAAMMNLVGEAMGVRTGGSYNDFLNASLENWGHTENGQSGI